MKVESTEPRVEIVPAPALAARHDPPQQDMAVLSNGLPAPAIVERSDSTQIARETLREASTPLPAPAAEGDRPQHEAPILPNELHVSPIVKPTDSAQVVREMVEEVYSSIQWRVGRFQPEASQPETIGAFPTSTPPLWRAGTDLTAVAEVNSAVGISSVVLPKNRIEGGPDSKT